MTNLQGHELEIHGRDALARMGMVCVYPLNQVPLLHLDPSGPYSHDDHLEFDYLIPCGDICLIGEITGRDSPGDVRSKYSRFRRQYNAVRGLQLGEQVWRLTGVPDEHLRDFREVREVRGFFVTTRLQKFDVNLSEVANIARLYKSDWNLLVEYSQSIGTYAKYHFLHRFNVAETASRHSLTLSKDLHSLMRTSSKKIASGDVGLADVYTFEVSPYELLSIARVYRRDELPSLSSMPESEYQRPLIPEKLVSIREKLLKSKDFMFPSSILVVLSDDCRYLDDHRTLIIPERYGAISVIDGQHRLFSYADEEVKRWVDNSGRIMVTAIQFRDANAEAIHKYSARSFVEINTNQTRVPPTHLDAIAYEILGETHPRAIAAQVILRANERRSSLYGLFDTNQTGLGIIRATTVLSALKSITHLEYIRSLQSAHRSDTRLLMRHGYESLFGAEIDELNKAETLIERGVICFEHYFNLVASVFSHDWPERGQPKNSSLEYAKMIAGLVKLLGQFISEGLDWQAVQTELGNIRANVIKLRDMQEYNAVLFDPTHPDMPNAQPSATDDYRFLNSNRRCATSIHKVIAQRRRR